MKKPFFYLCNVAVGIVNGLFGAGGGMLAVPLLKSTDISQKQSHANCVAVILPMTVFTAVLYLTKGRMTLSDALPFLLPGLLGALAGTLILAKISNKWLKKVFAVFMIWAGVSLVMR